jgi:hypothetical protein
MVSEQLTVSRYRARGTPLPRLAPRAMLGSDPPGQGGLDEPGRRRMNAQESTVTGPVTLSNSFLSETVQVCVVTRDHRRVMRGMVQAGIGPWRVYTFGPDTCTDLTLHGRPASFSMRLCVAFTGSMF